jgi:hypothetical protein
MIKKILVGLIAVVIVLAVVGLILPRHVEVKRSVAINRPASLVYAAVNSFVLFPKWSPWQDLDPNMSQSTQGPRDGVGAKLVWKGNDKVGSGTQVITASAADKSVASDLDFGDMGTAKSLMTLTPDGNMTRVTWTVDVDMGANPIGHYIGLTMDGMLGKDFASGLNKLKNLAESLPNTDIAGFSAEPVQLTATPILVVTETAPLDGIAKAYGDGFAQIGKFMAKNKLHQTGAPLGIDGEMTPGRTTVCRRPTISCWPTWRCMAIRQKVRCSRGTSTIRARRRSRNCGRRCTRRSSNSPGRVRRVKARKATVP